MVGPGSKIISCCFYLSVLPVKKQMIPAKVFGSLKPAAEVEEEGSPE
jgi:hypothetical protein